MKKELSQTAIASKLEVINTAITASVVGLNSIARSIKNKQLMIANYNYDIKEQIVIDYDFDKLSNWQHQSRITKLEVDVLVVKWKRYFCLLLDLKKELTDFKKEYAIS